MKKLKYTSAVLIICILLFSVAGCAKEKSWQSTIDGLNLSLMMTFSNNDYETFKNELLSESAAEIITNADFNEIKELRTDSAHSSNFELISFSNGEMILVELVYSDKDNEYKVKNMKKVPNESKEFFKSFIGN